jgi:effector-binding domain-containing protein
VWQFIADNDLSRKAQNVVVYHGEEGCAFHNEEGIPIEVGVQALQDFVEDDRVTLSSTPRGKVAGTLHIGPYQNLPQAHAAVRAWCAENGHELHGLNWEIYGHHTPNIEELETEVCYLLR